MPPPSSSPPSPSTSPLQSSSSEPTPAQKASILDAARTISPVSDIQRLPQIPCARYSLLFGIVAGASVGGLRFVFSRTGRRGKLYGGEGGGPWSEMLTAANWAVGAWGVGSLGAWETCRARQTAEAARMQALVADIKAKQAAKKSRPRPAGAGAEAGQSQIGGVLMGEKGKEILRERERERLAGGAAGEGAVAQEAEKGNKSWWQGRV